MQLWPGLHWGGQTETGDETEGASGYLRQGDDREVGHSGTCMEQLPPQTLVLDHDREQEINAKEALHIQMTPTEECFKRDRELVAGVCDEETGREEQSSLIFDLQ